MLHSSQGSSSTKRCEMPSLQLCFSYKELDEIHAACSTHLPTLHWLAAAAAPAAAGSACRCCQLLPLSLLPGEPPLAPFHGLLGR